MAFRAYTAEELASIARGLLRSLIPEADLSDLSDYDVSARLVAALGEGTQAAAAWAARQAFPDQADTDALLFHAERYGLTRLLPTAADGLVQVLGSTSGSTQAAGDTLEHADGTQYEFRAGITIALPAWTGKTVGFATKQRIIVSPNTTGMAVHHLVTINGEVRAIKAVLSASSAIDLFEPLSSIPNPGVAITATRGAVGIVDAVKTGAIGNKLVGDALTIDSPGVDVTAATRILECGGGSDTETNADLVARIIAAERGRPGAGNEEQFRSVARATDTTRVTEACVFPGYRGNGTVDVICIGPPGAREVSSASLFEVATDLAEISPYHLDVVLSSMARESTESPITVDVAVAPDDAPDWSSTLTTAAAGSTTTRVLTTTTPETVLEIGDRVALVVEIGGRKFSFLRVVTGVDAAGFNIGEALPAVPRASETITPGGPRWQAIYDALFAYADALSPSRKDVASGYEYERHPPISDLDDTLRIAAVYATCLGVDGVIDATVTAPAVDRTPNPTEAIKLGRILITFTVEGT